MWARMGMRVHGAFRLNYTLSACVGSLVTRGPLCPCVEKFTHLLFFNGLYDYSDWFLSKPWNIGRHRDQISCIYITIYFTPQAPIPKLNLGSSCFKIFKSSHSLVVRPVTLRIFSTFWCHFFLDRISIW